MGIAYKSIQDMQTVKTGDTHASLLLLNLCNCELKSLGGTKRILKRVNTMTLPHSVTCRKKKMKKI